jgi:cellulose biosynthesis protein BcsQ
VTLIVKGKGPDYSALLCQFLSKQGKKVLRLDCDFNAGSKTQKSGLLQYLEGGALPSVITIADDFDAVAAGGTSAFGAELIHSKRMQAYLKEVKQRYDWIVIVCSYEARNFEALSLLPMVDRALFTISDETVQELKPLIELSAQQQEKALFVFHSLP